MPDQPEPIPPDDLSRTLTIARPDEDQSLPHIGLVGDTYTILVAGKDTAGKYTLIDMHVPPGGGLPMSLAVPPRPRQSVPVAVLSCCTPSPFRRPVQRGHRGSRPAPKRRIPEDLPQARTR